jgi:hypothetical protein
VEPAGGSWTVFTSQKLPRNQEVVLTHGHEQPCTVVVVSGKVPQNQGGSYARRSLGAGGAGYLNGYEWVCEF